jgi:hypothetical protein
MASKTAKKSAPKPSAKAAAKPVKEAKAAKASPSAEKAAPKKEASKKPEKAAASVKAVEKVPVAVEKAPEKKLKLEKAKAPKAQAPKTLAPKVATPKVQESEDGPVEAKARKSAGPLDEEGEKLLKQWRQMHDQLKNVKPAVYTLSGNYEAKTPLQHKVLGWGYVLKNKGNRIDVLFEEGLKTLVTNYKPS